MFAVIESGATAVSAARDGRWGDAAESGVVAAGIFALTVAPVKLPRVVAVTARVVAKVVERVRISETAITIAARVKAGTSTTVTALTSQASMVPNRFRAAAQEARLNPERGSIQFGGAPSRLTNSQAGDLAKWLGYTKTKFQSSNQAVFTNGKNFITQDIKSHNGGTWKMASTVKDLGSKNTRTGTFNHLLEWIGP